MPPGLAVQPWLQEALGFRSTEHFKHTIQQSLTELSTQVCVAGQGWPGGTLWAVAMG